MLRVAVILLVLLAAAAPARAAQWEPAEHPSVAGQSQSFRAAAAFGNDRVWAAGYTSGAAGGALELRTLIQRWNGRAWRRIPTPDRETAPARDLLLDISAPGPARAWAVGSSAAAPGDPATRPLVLFWHGHAWRLVEGPQGFGGALVAVAAARNGTVWIAGEGRNPQTGNTAPALWLRAGTGWQEVPFPAPAGCRASANGLPASADLSDIASRGLRATYAVGSCTTPNGGLGGFLVRYDGVRWRTIVAPDVLKLFGPSALRGVDLAPDGELWAVGWADAAPISFRGRGASVALVPTPSQGNGASLQAVAAQAGGAAVAVGTWGDGAPIPRPHLLAQDAAGWVIESAPRSVVGNLFGVALEPAGTAWAVGVSSSDDSGLILRRVP